MLLNIALNWFLAQDFLLNLNLNVISIELETVPCFRHGYGVVTSDAHYQTIKDNCFLSQPSQSSIDLADNSAK